MLKSLARKFENNHVFTESESWSLFRLAAIGEACGWTMLISGILIVQYITPGNRDAVLVAGQLHGVLFIMYMLASVGLYPNLRWSRKRSFVALIASVPPYGSLVFEQWAKHSRNASQFKAYSHCIVLSRLTQAI